MSRDAAAHRELTELIRDRFPGRWYLHHLTDDQFAQLIDRLVADLVADRHDPYRRSRLHVAESARRTVESMRRNAAVAKAHAERPEPDRLADELRMLEHKLLVHDAHATAICGRLAWVKAKVAELDATDSGQVVADVPAVVAVEKSG